MMQAPPHRPPQSDETEQYSPANQYAIGMRLAFTLPSVVYLYDCVDQPGIGIEIAWNDGRKFWKPLMILWWGRRGIQFGWLWDKSKVTK